MPHSAVAREFDMQQLRKQLGLKTGDYFKYPSSKAEDYFVVKTSKIYKVDLHVIASVLLDLHTDIVDKMHEKGIELKVEMDQALGLMAIYKQEQANKVAPGGKK